MSLNILSIQSWVAYGHVGNASAIFPLQRLGAEVWGVHTVQFSNHTGYGAWRGQVFGADLIGECVAGIEERGVLGRCDAVLSGYLGSAEIGAAVRDAALKVKAANPQALWCCDPVIGDTGRGVFVRPGIPEFLRDQALPAADIATPNQFELEWLTGQVITSLDTAKAAITALGKKPNAYGGSGGAGGKRILGAGDNADPASEKGTPASAPTESKSITGAGG